MTPSITCRNSENIIYRFVDHASLGLNKTIQNHTPNLVEKAGNLGLWICEELPIKISNAMKDPRVVTIALTAFALLANSFLFYPTATWVAVKGVLSMINIAKHLPAIRFAAYILSCESIISYGARALGRFSNTELMNEFYKV